MDKKSSFLNKNQKLSGIFKRNEAVSVTLAVLLFLMLVIPSPFSWIRQISMLSRPPLLLME